MDSLKKYSFLFLLLAFCWTQRSLSQIVQAEYYIDTDPGLGSATALSATDGSFNDALESAFKSAVSVAPSGVHSLNVRVKDTHGNWGPVFTKIISVENVLATRNVNVAQAELFWDADPGQGGGTPLLAFDGNFDDALETVFKGGMSAPSAGAHKLCVRIKDADGNWGPVFTYVVSVENPLSIRSVNIAAAEYYWDTDPGQGSATAMLAFDGNFNDALETALKASISSPAAGTHKLGIRVRDASGTWGPAFTTIVSVENLLATRATKISAAEFYWDTDPGQGSGTTMIAFDGNFSDAVETALQTNVSVPAVGAHKFCVRLKDAAGTWGPVFTKVVSVENVFVPRDTRITQAELYWDTDPGQGSGTAMIAFDGNFNDALELVINSGLSVPSNGTHKLCIRVKDVAGNWGPVFTRVLSVENLLATRSTLIASAEMFVDADPGQGSGTAMIAFDGNFNDALETASHQVNTSFISPGMHTVNVRAKDAVGTWGPVFTVAMFIDSCMTTPNATITVVGSSTICPGDSVQLVANTGYTSYTWVSGITQIGTGSSIYVHNPGVYKVMVTDGNGCPGLSSGVVISTFSATVNTSGTGVFCQGDSLTLTAGTAASYTWSTGSNNQSIVVHSGGSYTVTETNSNGCTASSVITVTMNPLPSAPTITQSGTDLVSSASSGNQWYLNGVLIVGATSVIYTPGQSGNYAVTTTNSFGCSSTSAPFNFTYVGIESFVNDDEMKVFPNPFNEFSTLRYKLDEEAVVRIELFNAIGMRVATIVDGEKQNSGKYTYQLGSAQLADGLYTLRINMNGKQQVIRLVKQQ